MKYLVLLMISFLFSGCAMLDRTRPASIKPEPEGSMPGLPAALEVREFVLSPGDKIRIVVLGYEELSRSIIIPRDGTFYYPLIGEVNAKGKTIREVWQAISDGLRNYRDLTLSPGDDIIISIYRNDELNRRLVLPPDGKFYYPFAGEIDTTGRTLGDVRRIITDSLVNIVKDPQVSIDLASSIKPKIIADPQVSVEVTEYGGQKIFVLGEVNKPGVFYVGSGMSSLEAISMAGGFTNNAKQEEVLIIHGGLGSSSDIKKLDVEKFLTGEDLTQNIDMGGGDIVYVPSSLIADVDRFFQHFATIISPIVTLETGIILAPELDNAIKRGDAGGAESPRIIIPPR